MKQIIIMHITIYLIKYQIKMSIKFLTIITFLNLNYKISKSFKNQIISFKLNKYVYRSLNTLIQ